MPELNITDDEAAMLAAVLVYVGGSPTNSPREHEWTLSKKLNDLGYSFTRGKAKKFHKLIQSGGGKYAGIVFEDYKDLFVPGYYRYAGLNADPHVSAHWYETDPGNSYVRVNVTPALDRQPGDELSEEDLVALPIGAKVRDRDLDTWTKAPNGYWYITDDGEYATASSGYVMGFDPIHLVSE